MGKSNSKLTPAVRKRIVALIRAGNFRETACAAAGIESNTLRVWLRKGRENRDSAYGRFAEEMMRAESEAESRGVIAVQMAANRDWRAASWWLEKKFPEKWGGKSRVEVSGPHGGPVQISTPTIYLPAERKNEDSTGLPDADEFGDE